MGVDETSKEAYEKIRPYLGSDQRAVYEIIAETGPVHDRRILEAINQKEAATLKPRELKRTWEINEIAGRRNELKTKGCIWFLGRFRGLWHGKPKLYKFYSVKGDSRSPEDFGWAKYVPREKIKPKPEYRNSKQIQSTNYQNQEKPKGQLRLF